MPILKRTIIGVFILLGLIVQSQNVHALWSPIISKQVGQIKQHILEAREVNGTGTLASASAYLQSRDDEARAQNTAVGTPAGASTAQQEVRKDVIKNIFYAPLDAIYSIFNIYPSTEQVVSNCLRDDIWYLEDLKDVVVQEMIKSYLMGDGYHGDILRTDYKYLRDTVNDLKQYGGNPTKEITEGLTSSRKFFGADNTINYYTPIALGGENGVGVSTDECEEVCLPDCDWFVDEKKEECIDECNSNCTLASTITWEGCPDAEFLDAINETWESIKTFGVIASGSSVEWGDIWEMAEARAKIRAAEWIEANQITLTIGGEKGGNAQSLVKGGGWDKFVGKVKTELGILVNNVLGPVTPLFDWSLFRGDQTSVFESGCVYYQENPANPDAGVFTPCTEQQLKDYDECVATAPNLRDVIECGKSRNINKKATAIKRIKDFQAEATAHNKELQKAETAYVYNMQLNSVGEQNLIETERVLWKINMKIKQGYEGVSKDAGNQLPTILQNLEGFDKKHCPNK
ncbi:hypothetical protein KKA95_03105 [Patescibacteria group bacterium]|nr:hypothetical protein [Patescibacteria group bacterium]